MHPHREASDSKRERPGRAGFRPDWALLAIMAASLCATARYQRPFEPDRPTGGVRYVLNGDQTYFVALAQELERSDPSATCSIRAGVRERPYHHLSHLTLALLAREGHATDILRLHLVTGYSVLVCLACGLTFCLTRELSGSRPAGLFGAFLLFAAAIPTPPLLDNAYHVFYFTIWPQASSSVEPVLLTSPQMFYGIVLSFAVLLALLRIGRSYCEDRSSLRLAILAALLAAFLMRSRIHCFIVLGPVVGLTLACLVARRRIWPLLGPLSLLVGISAAEFFEMHMSCYLEGGQGLRLGNNRLTLNPDYSLLNAWPGTEFVASLVSMSLPTAFAEWVWQFVSLSAFSALNVGFGSPLCCGVFIYIGFRCLLQSLRQVASVPACRNRLSDGAGCQSAGLGLRSVFSGGPASVSFELVSAAVRGRRAVAGRLSVWNSAGHSRQSRGNHPSHGGRSCRIDSFQAIRN